MQQYFNTAQYYLLVLNHVSLLCCQQCLLSLLLNSKYFNKIISMIIVGFSGVSILKCYNFFQHYIFPNLKSKYYDLIITYVLKYVKLPKTFSYPCIFGTTHCIQVTTSRFIRITITFSLFLSVISKKFKQRYNSL